MIQLYHQLAEFLTEHPQILWGLVGFSLLAFLSTLILIPILMLQIPVDYFAGEEAPRSAWQKLHPVPRLFCLIGKNLLGLVMIFIGFTLLFLPGQGLLTMVFGILILDFPGRYRLKRWLIQRPAILRSVNWLREHYGRPPLRFSVENNARNGPR